MENSISTAVDRFPLGAPVADVPAFRFDLDAIPFQYTGVFAATIEDPVARERYLEAFGPDFA